MQASPSNCLIYMALSSTGREGKKPPWPLNIASGVPWKASGLLLWPYHHWQSLRPVTGQEKGLNEKHMIQTSRSRTVHALRKYGIPAL